MGLEEEKETKDLNPHSPAPPSEKVWLPVYLDEEGKLAKHNLHAADYWFQVKMMLRERFFDGLRKGIPIQELVTSTHKNYIFKHKYLKTFIRWST